MAAEVADGNSDSSLDHFYFTLRLIGALVAVTIVPLLIDRRARRSKKAVR